MSARTKAEELVKQMINAIADKDYTKLISCIPPKLSWASYIDAEPTLKNACMGFGKWLDEQLAMWEDDYDKKFAVDHFDESCIEDADELDELSETDSPVMITYNPASDGEPLDFWFEIDFLIEDGQISAEFDVNI